jgi:hypothetical protein
MRIRSPREHGKIKRVSDSKDLTRRHTSPPLPVRRVDVNTASLQQSLRPLHQTGHAPGTGPLHYVHSLNNETHGTRLTHK